MKPPFERTKCDCMACRIGCETKPGTLMPHDLPNFDEKDLCASEGSLVMDLKAGKKFHVPSIVPKQRPNGHCIFYEYGHCTVHDHSPFGCAYFDMHAKRDDAVHWGTMQLMGEMQFNGEYYQTFERLWNKGVRARPIAERTAAFEQEERKLWALIHKYKARRKRDTENQGQHHCPSA